MEETTPFDQPDFAVPQRQSPAAIIIMMLRAALVMLKTFWPALLVILVRTNKVSEAPKLLIMIGALGVLTVGVALIRYFFYYFHVHNDNLVIRTGWIKKKTMSIPLKSMQAVHLEQNVWQQVFGVARVSFDSAGSEKVEAKIDALQMKKAEQLKQLLLSHAAGEPTAVEQQEVVQAPVYRLEAADLLKLSLSANHLEAFLILVALSLNLLDDLKKAFEIDGWQWMERVGGEMENNMTVAVTVLLLFAAFVSVAYSSFRTVIKYFNFTLQSEHKKWKISFGLLNRQQRIIPHNKIQVYSWHTNWLRCKINFWMLDIKTIGTSALKEKQKVKIPLTNLDAAIGLANVYQQAPVLVPREGLMIEPDYWKRRTLLIALPVTLLLMLIGYLVFDWHGLWAGLLFFYFGYRNYQWYRNFRWYANDEGLQLYSGLWGRRYTLLCWRNVQQVKLLESPYQRKHGLASVQFKTAGGDVNLPFIKLEAAQQLANLVLYLVEDKNEPWM
ncbi:PH domain-containing protein [Aridibaculum aurantiacum]|uniref:PH domain-containing protein n=1 Tax=Aridibaculum aurantiacum TaxID=2810307 RepID=UPI001A96EFBF|nr:PH domain-containing protein [Aridibaculum aurantiacum]